MNTPCRILLALTLVLGVAHPAFAQQPAPIDDPEADILSDVLVLARSPGPAWWRVSKGGSVVWILGMPAGAIPKTLVWDQSAVERRLTGAQALLLPPQVSITFGASDAQALALVRFLPGVRQVNGNVEKDMPPPLAERFNRIRTRLNKPVRRYSTPAPLLAAFNLHSDSRAAAGLQQSGGWGQVEAAAKRHGVAVSRPPIVKLGTVELDDMALDRPEAAACFDALLDGAEVPTERYRTAAAGWAQGNLHVAITAPRDPMSICENRLFQQGYTRRSIDSQVKAIEAALTKPGTTVALSHLRTLLASQGIVERLAADGYEIIDPAEMPVAD